MNKEIAKTSLMIAVFCLAISISIPGQALASWMASYYKTHPMSTDQLRDSWGKPVNVIKIENGVEKMIFGPKDVVIGYTYFLTRNGQVIDRGVTDTADKKAVSKANKGPEPKGIMANYYKSNPVSINELKAKWGNPISNHDYENGIKKLMFGPKDPEIGYTYFLIKDGIVIDKNVTGN